jgi:molecular chaperone GrpE
LTPIQEPTRPEAEAGVNPELAEWKELLREDFEQWLSELEQVPEPEEAPGEAPDLYSFFEQLAAANAETRKANRRTAEAISQWGETLSRFDQSLAPLKESVDQLAAAQPRTGELSRAHCLMLVELLDRLQRIGRAYGSAPAKSSWWGHDAAWRKAWENQQRAFEIVLSHLEGILKKEGVTRIEVMGELLDPTVMTAVAVEPDANRPSQTVLEEITAGYRRQGELLRPAQVKVSQKV